MRFRDEMLELMHLYAKVTLRVLDIFQGRLGTKRHGYSQEVEMYKEEIVRLRKEIELITGKPIRDENEYGSDPSLGKDGNYAKNYTKKMIYITDIIANNQAAKYRKSVAFIIITASLATAIDIFYISKIEGISLVFSHIVGLLVSAFLLTILLNARKRLLEYRISKGYYGNNYREAKEMLMFIENELDDQDLSGGSSRRRAFPDAEELEDSIELIGSEVVQ